MCMMQMTEMKPIEVEGKQRLTFIAPSRGLIGFRSASFVAHYTSFEPFLTCQKFEPSISSEQLIAVESALILSVWEKHEFALCKHLQEHHNTYN